MHAGWVIRVLGPIDVLTPEGERSVGGRRRQTLLGALAISVGHAVPSDRLIDVLWGTRPPPTAQATLQAHVSKLRRLLGRDSIASFDHAYELYVAPHQIDAIEFERLVIAAREAAVDPARCQALCREALQLWRGVPFGELADVDPFRLEALRLDELRLCAMELELAAELELGRADLLIGKLETAVAEHPYRERLWHLLIEALADDGRRIDALAACARLRDLLAEAGLEPGDELRRCEEQIARGTWQPRWVS